MHDAGLHDRLGPDRLDRFGQAFEAVAADEDDVFDAAGAELAHDLEPELRPSAVSIHMPSTCLMPSVSTPTAR